jgi:predicted membrane-bound dolichyl-phosphate-mannose-protein mannosyltransferase
MALNRLRGWASRGGFWLTLILLVNLALHLVVVGQPPELMFDEQHYVPDARSILAGEGDLRPEHPPLGKLFVAASITVFGDNPAGWRLFSVLFGLAGLVLFYFICRRLGLGVLPSVLAFALLAFENFTFVQGGVAMLDVFMCTFMLAAFWLYLKGWLPLAALAGALAALCKLPGVFALAVIFLHWLITGRKQMALFLVSMALSPVLFIILLGAFNSLIAGHYIDPIQSIRDMSSLSGSLTFANTPSEQGSRPWEWVVKPLVLPYFYHPDYMGAVSFSLWALILPSLGWLVYLSILGSTAARFGLAWFAGAYLAWIPLQAFTDRITYVFYFYPTAGALCLAVGLGLACLVEWWRARRGTHRGRAALAGVTAFLAIHLTVFIILSPVTTLPR